ncbi:cleavage stimulation factor subunit 2 [Microdochium nivale]|nr:cleavage stimulation factor subunit 2 [Microdochium nivale]
MSSKAPSRVVFVGNIPYGLSEEQISDIFSTAGKVINFRLVYDRETGRPKGFGFAEYPDPDSAASAVRNLNDYEIMGRKLRVDYSSEGKLEEHDGLMPPTTTMANNTFSQPANGTSHPANPPAGSLPPLPPGKELPPGVTATDAISRTLNTLPPAQLLDILSQMKSLASTDAARATELLAQAPQLSYAIFQALLLMGLVSPEAISSVVDTSAPQMPPAMPPHMGYPAVPVPGYPSAPTATPPVAAPYAPPVAAAPAPAPTSDQDALVQQVLSLPQEVIDQLPEGERQQIMALRNQLLSQRR